MTANVETMFYNTMVPWHGLGTKLDNVATAEEAITAAQLDWEVKSMPLYVHNAKGRMHQVEGLRAIQRRTDGKVLSVLGEDYIPVQNANAFTFFDAVVGNHEAHYETAGSLNGGKRIWILAKVDGSISVRGDEIHKYLLLCNGHDGQMAVKMFFTPIRVVCQNTLEAAGATRFNPDNNANMFYSRHTGGMMGRMDEAREVLGFSTDYFDQFSAMSNHLAEQPFLTADMPKLLTAAFQPAKQLPTDSASGPIELKAITDAGIGSRVANDMVTVAQLFETGKGLQEASIQHTKYAAYNAVVEYVDYGRKYGGADPANLRLNNVWFGRGARMKQRALAHLLKN